MKKETYSIIGIDKDACQHLLFWVDGISSAITCVDLYSDDERYKIVHLL